ncbi:hypothetical protein FDP25_01690 [Roseovarius sp. A21]|uniref:Uncharacterized protein n=1 Tax=Roseovarius bejariae TaxID=2576383 RepID=A0A844CFU4_9RHOB|nr:hypothetical protein [Roseovarius bejariae]MRU14131.1 hypothetical protein [Roseovarius bejariae]
MTYSLFKMQPIVIHDSRTAERQRSLPPGYTAATDQDRREVVLCPDGRVIWWNTWEAEQRRKATVPNAVLNASDGTTDLDEHDADHEQWPDDMR